MQDINWNISCNNGCETIWTSCCSSQLVLPFDLPKYKDKSLSSSDRIMDLFSSDDFKEYMQKFWPKFVAIANAMSTHNGRIGQEVGKLRERALIYLLYRFLGEDIDECPIDDSDVGVHEKEKDVSIFDRDVSIKTLTGKNGKYSPLKLSWVDDQDKAKEFIDNFKPTCDLLVACIDWGNVANIYYIDCETQTTVLDSLPSDKRLVLAKGYTKGTRLHSQAWLEMLQHENTLKLPINWPIENKNDNMIDQFWDLQYLKIDKENYDEEMSSLSPIHWCAEAAM